MSSKSKYDPEDIESLLLNKEFSELYKEEKAFILRHIDSEEEYNAMRKALLNITTSNNEDIPLIPDSKIKDAVMEAFETSSQRKVTWIISLNQLFANFDFYRKPAVQIAFASIILLFITYFIFIKPDNYQENSIAEKRYDKVIEDTPSETEIEDKSDINVPQEVLTESLASETKTEDVTKKDLRESDLIAMKTPIDNKKMEIHEEVYQLAEDKITTDYTYKGTSDVYSEEISTDSESRTALDAVVSGKIAESDESVISVNEIAVTETNYTRNIKKNNSTTLAGVVSKESKFGREKARRKKYKNEIRSHPLNEDAELIDILFTAL